MITMSEILGNVKFDDLPKEHQDNLAILLERINKIRALWGKPMKVTSGYRSKEDQLRIYKEKGITDISKIPMGSNHLKAAAIDIYDPKLEVTQWLKDNPQILEDACLWCEDGNKNWVHAQIYPFRSYKAGGTRWFKP